MVVGEEGKEGKKEGGEKEKCVLQQTTKSLGVCVGGVLKELPGIPSCPPSSGHPGTEQVLGPGVNSFGLLVLHHFGAFVTCF